MSSALLYTKDWIITRISFSPNCAVLKYVENKLLGGLTLKVWSNTGYWVLLNQTTFLPPADHFSADCGNLKDPHALDEMLGRSVINEMKEHTLEVPQRKENSEGWHRITGLEKIYVWNVKGSYQFCGGGEMCQETEPNYKDSSSFW